MSSSDEELYIVALAESGKAIVGPSDGLCPSSAGAKEKYGIRHLLPGDIFAAKQHGREGRSILRHELLEATPRENDLPCEVQKQCGGCPLMPLQKERAEQSKQEWLRYEFAEHGIDLPTIVANPSLQPLHYRTRIRLHVENGQLAFFNESKDWSCAVLTEQLRHDVEQARQALSDLQAIEIDHVEIRQRDLDGSPAMHISPHHERIATELARALQEWKIGSSEEPALQRISLTSETFAYLPTVSFSQVHAQTNSQLINAIVSGAQKRNAETFVDLCSGIGNFALPLAASGLRGMAVEFDALACAAMGRSASEQSIDNIVIVNTDANEELGDMNIDLLVVDPPRGGLQKTHTLINYGAKHIAWISCHPPQMASNIRAMLDLGYKLDSVETFEMFPQTQHIETLCWLSR